MRKKGGGNKSNACTFVAVSWVLFTWVTPTKRGSVSFKQQFAYISIFFIPLTEVNHLYIACTAMLCGSATVQSPQKFSEKFISFDLSALQTVHCTVLPLSHLCLSLSVPIYLALPIQILIQFSRIRWMPVLHLIIQKKQGTNCWGISDCIYTVKKVTDFSVSRLDVTYQTLPGRE